MPFTPGDISGRQAFGEESGMARNPLVVPGMSVATSIVPGGDQHFSR
jgi:hypothetical protein